MELEQILAEQQELESARANFDQLWSDIAKLVLPYEDQFFGSVLTPGQRNSQKVFDATPTKALDRFVAAVNDMLTPASRRWHNIVPMEQFLKDDGEVKAYLEFVRDTLFTVRYAPTANFASNMAEVYKSLGAFGVGCLFVDEERGRGIRYRNVHVGEIYISQNHVGMIDKVHRKFKYTARQAVQRLGDKCPQVIREAAQSRPEKEFEFIHCVKPNDQIDPRRADYRGMKYSSYYVSCEGKEIIDSGGYRTMPYIVGRYSPSLNSPYGISIAIQALPDIQMLNQMEKTIIRAGQQAVEPTLLAAADDGALAPFRMIPGAINYGALSEQGQELVKPLQTGANIPLGLELSDQRRRAINESFLVTIFQILVEETREMTATEVMQRAAEKGALLGPPMGRLQTELLGPLIEREMDILGRTGMFGDMPEALIRTGGGYEIEYSSELARLQKAGDGVAIQRTLEALTPLAQIDPSVLGVFKFDETARILAEVNGVPAKAMKTKDEMEAEKQAAASQQQAAALLQAAPLAGKAAKDLAQAQSIAAASPSAVLPAIV